jgi:hypothetical protein
VYTIFLTKGDLRDAQKRKMKLWFLVKISFALAVRIPWKASGSSFSRFEESCLKQKSPVHWQFTIIPIGRFPRLPIIPQSLFRGF